MLMVVCGVYPRKRDPVDPLRARCGAVRVRLQISGPYQIVQAALQRRIRGVPNVEGHPVDA
jgi:hypothetical protein